MRATLILFAFAIVVVPASAARAPPPDSRVIRFDDQYGSHDVVELDVVSEKRNGRTRVRCVVLAGERVFTLRRKRKVKRGMTVYRARGRTRLGAVKLSAEWDGAELVAFKFRMKRTHDLTWYRTAGLTSVRETTVTAAE